MELEGLIKVAELIKSKSGRGILDLEVKDIFLALEF